MADEKNDVGNNIFTSAIVAAPTVIGAAMAGSKIRSAWDEISSVTSPARVPQIRESIRQFAEGYTANRTPWKISGYLEEIGQIADFVESSDAMGKAFGQDKIREIARMIASKSDPTGRIAETLVKRLENVQSGSEALDAISMYLSGTSSIYAQKFGGMFTKDLRALSARVAAGQPIETVGWKGKIPRYRIPVAPAQWEARLGSQMATELTRMQKVTGAELGVEILGRRDIAGQQLNVYLEGGRVPGRIKLKIPRVLKNQYLVEGAGPFAGMGTVVKSGSTQQSRRIAGVYGVVEAGTLRKAFNYEEWSLYRFNEEVLPHLMNNSRIKQREVNRIIREHEQRMIATAEWTHSVKDFSSVEEYIKSKGSNIHLFEPSQDISPVFGRGLTNWPEKFAPVDVDTLAGLIESGGLDTEGGSKIPLFPGSGPTQAAGGIASLRDPRIGVGLMPSAVPTARRPLQFVKPNWSPSRAAIEAMAANPVNQRLSWAAKNVGVQTPMLKSAFVSSRYQHMLEGTGLHAEGQFLLSRRRATEMAMDEISQIKIDASRIGPDLAPLIDPARGAHWNINKTLKEGAFLGYSPEGSAIMLPADMTLLHGTVFGDKQEGTFLRLAVTQPRESVNFAKYQGIKATAALAKEDQLLEVLSKAGAEMPPGFQASAMREVSVAEGMNKALRREGLENLQEDIMAGATGEEALFTAKRAHPKRAILDAGVDAIFMMDELKKNRSLHYNQMFTALWEFNSVRMQGNLQLGSQVMSFQNDPRAWISQLEETAKTLPAAERDLFKMQEISKLARASKLTPQEMAGVFAAVPEAMADIGGINVLGNLNQKQLRAIQTGTAVGYTQLYFAGAGPETGAGGHAPLEPRTLELLQGPVWGELGPKVQEDIMQRMIAAYPERLFEQKELITSLSSMRDLASRAGSLSPTQMIESAGKGLLPMEGASMRISGFGDIYIPGASTMRQLSAYQTPSGKIIDMPLTHSYRDLIEMASAYEKKNITREVMRKKIDEVATLTSQAAIGTITGKGGLARNKMLGSAYLRAEDISIGMRELTADVGVSESIGERMLKEMEAMGIYSKADVEGMKERFASGESIAGWIQRDPSIGPYSIQPVTIQKLRGAGRAAVFREQRYKAFAKAGMFQDITAGKAFLDEARRALAAGEGTDLRISPMVGLSGDFDADNVSISFAGPQLEEALRRKAGNTLEYENYIIRQQMLKAKAPIKIIEAAEDMAESIYSLSVTGGEQIGKLSVRLQEYRAGVLMGAGGLGQEEGLNALSLLEWLEQVPISAKHVEKGRASELPRLLEEIRTHLSRGDAEGISNAAKTVMRNAKDANKAAMLSEGVTVALEGPGGQVSARRIAGLDVDAAARGIVKAREAMSASQEGQMVMGRVRQLFMEQGPRMRAEEAFSVLGEDFVNKSPFGALIQAATSTPKGPMSELSKRALAAKNRMASLGKGMLQHAKPLAIGFGISLGLSMLLAEPPRVLEPGSNIPPQPDMRSGSGGQDLPTNLHPESRVQGAPSVPSMTGARQTARVANADFNINIRGRSGNKIDYSALGSQLRNASGGRARVQTHVRDQRSSLTPQKLSSIIQGR